MRPTRIPPKLTTALVLFILLLAVCALSSCADAETSAAAGTEAAETTVDPNTEYTVTYSINIEEAGTIYPKLDTTQTGKYGETVGMVYAEANKGYKFVKWSDGFTKPIRQTDIFDADEEITAIFDYDCNELPVLDIRTFDGSDITTRSEYKAVSVTVANTEVRWSRSNLPAGMRGRGNATWGMEKKSYRLRFEEKINLFDMDTGKERTWVLMANHCDQSLLRNYAAMALGNMLDGIKVSSSGRFVDLFLNGDYRGVYLLCEQPEVNENRVPVDDEVPVDSNGEYLADFDITDVGYMFELDQYSEGTQYIDRFDAAHQPYTIKSEIISEEQGKWLRDFVSEAHGALKGGDYFEIAEYIDIDSALDMYITHEFLKNIDVGWSSFYMFIPEAASDMPRVIYFGPPWDFDLAAGNDYRLDNGSFEDLYAGTGRRGFSQSSQWFMMLMETDWFAELAAERWLELSDTVIPEFIDHLATTASESMGSMIHNFVRWPIFGQRLNQEPEQVMELKSYDEHVMYLLDWLENRKLWLDDYFAGYLGLR